MFLPPHLFHYPRFSLYDEVRRVFEKTFFERLPLSRTFAPYGKKIEYGTDQPFQHNLICNASPHKSDEFKVQRILAVFSRNANRFLFAVDFDFIEKSSAQFRKSEHQCVVDDGVKTVFVSVNHCYLSDQRSLFFVVNRNEFTATVAVEFHFPPIVITAPKSRFPTCQSLRGFPQRLIIAKCHLLHSPYPRWLFFGTLFPRFIYL